MFSSFFPSPRAFFASAVIWAAVSALAWHLWGQALGEALGLVGPGDAAPVIGVSRFWSRGFLWFYAWFAGSVLAFAAAWRAVEPHPWAGWSVLGSALILFSTYFDVEVSVAINDWYGPFYDMIQGALAGSAKVTMAGFYAELATFLGIALLAVTIGVLTRFFVSHWIFRWRSAMNDHYTVHWERLRTVEGASQRVQDDTMRFSSTIETLGVSLVSAAMTLIAFLPVLMRLSEKVTEMPLIGHVPHALVGVALIWAAFGTGFLALVGIRLPGLQFANQQVEAAYRKELVYGEDDADAASPPTLRDLFGSVRRNYFRLYFHYTYFNVARILYLQTDVILPYVVLAPTIVVGAITLGAMQQILNAFGRVRDSFQYLVNSWTTIVELMSIYKRLRGLDAVIGPGGTAPQPVAAVPAPRAAIP